MGVLIAALDPLTAPRTTNNFVFLAALPLLRRVDVPPGDPGVHVPGR